MELEVVKEVEENLQREFRESELQRRLVFRLSPISIYIRQRNCGSNENIRKTAYMRFTSIYPTEKYVACNRNLTLFFCNKFTIIQHNITFWRFKMWHFVKKKNSLSIFTVCQPFVATCSWQNVNFRTTKTKKKQPHNIRTEFK